MANEFKHKDPGGELTQAEFVATCGDGHIFASQATGDLLYADSATVLKKLARGSTTQMLQIASCKPAWTSTPSLGTTSWCNMNHAHGAGNSGGTVCANVLAGTTLKSCVVTSSLTTVGALNSGSISCGFGAIDNGSSAITTTGLISGGSLDIDNVLINGTTIGHTCDTDLMTVGNACLTIKGSVTVGVDDTGHDVKFFGAAAGAYMLYDQSCDQLEIRGASADATTSTGKLLLSTSLTNVNANDVIGSINFQAPAEAGGTDAIAIAAGIRAVAQATFTCAVNSTDLIFYTGHSEAATEKFRFTSQGEIGVGGANYGNCGQVLTSGGAGAAPSWACAGGGAVSAVANGANDRIATFSSACALNGEATLTFGSNALTFDNDHDGNNGINLINCSNTSSASTRLTIQTGGDCAGDAALLLHAGGTSWLMGVDNSANEELKIAQTGGNLGTNDRVVINTAGLMFLSDTANANSTIGLTINQGASDNEILALKSSDVAHGVTNSAETDTFFKIQKLGATAGGAELYGFGNGSADQGFRIQAINHAAANTTKSASGNGVFDVISRQANGVTTQSVGANGNLVSFRDDGSARFLFDEDGEMHADGAVASAFDDYCDAQLSRALTLVSSMATKPCKSYSSPQSNKWDEFIRYNEQDLIDAKILGGPVHGVPDDERGLLNVTALQRLHNGAIWQLHSKLNDQAEEINALKGQLNALTEGK
jgi:hypothetical protein